jgi:fibronectin type 3 domain-containing protein
MQNNPAGGATAASGRFPAASVGIGHVSLDWDANIETDLAGYDIYRSQTSGGFYTLIQNVTASEYLDNNVDNGTRYFYVVTAKDTSGHVSGNSNEDRALPPDLTDDDKIDLGDLAEVVQAWLTTYDIDDLSVIAENWLAY